MSNTAIAYILVFGALLAAALFRNPRYGLYAYVATFYLHPVDRWWGRDLPDLRWSLIAAAVTLFATMRLPAQTGRPGWAASTGVKIIVALTGWIWIQNLWALSADDHLELSILYTKYVVLLYLIYRLVDDEETIRNFLVAHVLGCFYLGILVLQAPDSGRLEGVGGPGINEANALAMHLSTGAVAAAVLLVRGGVLQRTFALAALAVIANGIVQTESRGAFLGLAAGGITLFVLSPARFRRAWVVLGALGLVLLLRIAPESFWNRMSTISTTAETEQAVDQSSETRLLLVQAQWHMFLAYPMGSGHRGTAVLSPRYLSEENLSRSSKDPNSQPARSSHNTFMTALSEQGIPGALMVGGLLAWLARTGLTTRRHLQEVGREQEGLYLAAVCGSLAIVVVAGMFTDYFKAEVFIWGIALLSVLASAATTSSSASTIENEALPHRRPEVGNPSRQSGSASSIGHPLSKP